jgi:metal-responsive CopG/Arc/MetJ family transcriptional regulator
MKRVDVNVNNQQYKKLKSIARAEGKSISRVVREALDMYFMSKQTSEVS